MAQAAGVQIEMEMTIFLAACTARVIGITGTKGKTTTSALCGAMLRAGDPSTVVAGNMGVSALAHLPEIAPETPVVLELSSWQLEAMNDRKIGPAIAVITNISEDHLDTYADFQEYAETKRSIAAHLLPGDVLVLNGDDPMVAATIAPPGVRTIRCGTGLTGSDAIAIENEHLVSTLVGRPGKVQLPTTVALRGDHQKFNCALAMAAALACGASFADVEAGIAAFTGVANRMELVGECDGITFVNDTAATAPAAAIASLRAWSDRPIHVIAGGADKRLEFSELAAEMVQRASTITLLDGTATTRLQADLRSAGWTGIVPIVRSMDEAVQCAGMHAKPGSVVLLSPGCASFGLFRDEFDRGDQFRSIVQSRIERIHA
jgi:UDP-N-acetylmuramoylalanine--D-glutamate ligase